MLFASLFDPLLELELWGKPIVPLSGRPWAIQGSKLMGKLNPTNPSTPAIALVSFI